MADDPIKVSETKDEPIKAESEEKTPGKSYKIKVGGQEREVTYEQLIELAQKGNDYTQKTQTLAEKEKALKTAEEEVKEVKVIVDEMKENPKLADALNKAYEDVKSGKISKPEVKDRNLKRLDKLIEDADDPTQKENLREMRTIIAEETGTQGLREEVKTLRDEISTLKNTTLIGRSERIESQMKGLDDRFTKGVIDKYRKDITAMALKYPNQSVGKLFYHFADDKDIKAALLNEAEKEKKTELERKKKGSGPGGEESVTSKIPLEKDAAGRTTMKSIMARVKEKAGL